MKKVLFVLAFCLIAISSYAKLEGDGYYRIKNVGSGRYITVRDNRGSIDIASTSADLGAVELYKGFDNVVSDPSSVLYVQDCGGGFKFYAQGTDTYEIIGYYLKVKLNNDGETYKAYQSNDYLMMYLGDVEMSSVIDGVLGTNANGTLYASILGITGLGNTKMKGVSYTLLGHHTYKTAHRCHHHSSVAGLY